LDSSARSFSQRENSLRTRPSLFSPFSRETVPAQASTDFLIQHHRLFPRGPSSPTGAFGQLPAPLLKITSLEMLLEFSQQKDFLDGK
jgi:hypothetical protein